MVTYQDIQKAYTEYVQTSERMTEAHQVLEIAQELVPQRVLTDQQDIERWLMETRSQQVAQTVVQERVNKAELEFATARDKLALLLKELSPAWVKVKDLKGNERLICYTIVGGRPDIGQDFTDTWSDYPFPNPKLQQ